MVWLPADQGKKGEFDVLLVPLKENPCLGASSPLERFRHDGMRKR